MKTCPEQPFSNRLAELGRALARCVAGVNSPFAADFGEHEGERAPAGHEWTGYSSPGGAKR